jgi:hypothetical protein
VALVHLSYNDGFIELNQSELLEFKNNQIISLLSIINDSTETPVLKALSLLVANSSVEFENKIYKISQSDSIIYTLLGLLNKRDLINEQSGKYFVQYFQFFSYYSSLGLQQVTLIISIKYRA